MNIGVRGAGITARKKEGRFWHRGRVHQVSALELSAGDVHAVTSARTGCGEDIAWPVLAQGPSALEGDSCARRGCLT